MEKKLRAFLLNILGAESYLSFVSGMYIRMIRLGLMKKKYPELFYLRDLIGQGFICVDLGANVGYYSSFLSLYCGKTGHVYAVEPVPLFARIFRKNTSRFGRNNITLFQTALGGENKPIRMGTPVIDGVFRHGLTRVIDEKAAAHMQTYEVEMKIPDELFSFLQRLDFIKCDVEGYEVFIMPHFIQTIARFKPLIQMEISSPENRGRILDLFSPLGYSAYALENHTLKKLAPDEALRYDKGDFYFK